MTRQAIIDRTIAILHQLPEEKVAEVSDFVEFIIKRYEEQNLTAGIQLLSNEGKVYDFLNEEEDLYTVSDLKEVYK